MIKFTAYFILVGHLLNAGMTTAQHSPRSVTDKTISLDSNVRYGQLDNGFTYYIRHNDNKHKGEVELRMVVKAGYFHEDEDQLEYAHLLEHMGATGTTNFPSDYIKSSGGSKNAHTRNDHTYYEARIPSENKKLLKNGLRILRDWAQEIRLDQESIDVQRGAVLGEMRGGNVYNRWLYDTIVSTVLGNTAFQRPKRERYAANIQNFNRESFVRFYHDWYRPDLQAAIIVGDIDVDSVEVEIKRLFADLHTPKQPLNAATRVAAQTIQLDGQNQVVSIHDSIQTDFRLYILSKFPNHSYYPKTKADYKNRLLQEVYRELLEIRIKNDLSLQQDPSIDYQYYHIGITGQIKATRMTLAFDHDGPEYVKKKVIHAATTIRRLNTGFTKTELDAAKRKVWERYLTSQKGENHILASNYKEHFVGGAAAPSPEVRQKLTRSLLDDINLHDVHALARRHVDLNHNTDFLFFSGGQVSIPDSSTLNSWLAEAMAQNVEPYTATVQPVMSLRQTVPIPVGGNIEITNMTENLIGVTTIELSNGIKLMLKPTKAYSRYTSSSVQIIAFRPNGLSWKNRSEYIAAILAPEIVRHVGAGPYAKFQLDQFRQDNGVTSLRFEMARMEQSIKGECHPDHVEDLLQLLYLTTQVPRMDSVAFRDWKRLKRSELEGSTQILSPSLYESMIEQMRFPKMPVMGRADLDQLSMEEIYAAYDRWYSSFNGYTFIVTGDFDKDQLLPVLVKYLSTLPEGRRPDTSADNGPVVPLRKLDKTTYVKHQEGASVFLRFPVLAPTDTKTKILVSLLSSALYSRIHDRLRAAGCYAPGANFDLIDSKTGLYETKIWFDGALGNEDNMIRYALEEFRQLREKGVDEVWFEKTIAYRKTIYGRRFDSSGFWYKYLKEKQSSNEDMMAELLQEETILGHFITLDDVNNAAKKYLTEQNLQQFLILPEGYQKVD